MVVGLRRDATSNLAVAIVERSIALWNGIAGARRESSADCSIIFAPDADWTRFH